MDNFRVHNLIAGRRAGTVTLKHLKRQIEYFSALLLPDRPSSQFGTTNKNINKVVLIRLGAVSHAFNFNQSVSLLNFKKTNNTHSVLFSAPTDRNVVPPGHYMLFVVNSSGIPSVAKILQVM